VRRAIRLGALPLLILSAVVLMILATGAFAQQPSVVAALSSGSVPQPGMVINNANLAGYARVLPSAADLAIKYGLMLRVVPSQRLDWSGDFTAETEKYSG
jgi:hypothetical protein